MHGPGVAHTRASVSTIELCACVWAPVLASRTVGGTDWRARAQSAAASRPLARAERHHAAAPKGPAHEPHRRHQCAPAAGSARHRPPPAGHSPAAAQQPPTSGSGARSEPPRPLRRAPRPRRAAVATAACPSVCRRGRRWRTRRRRAWAADPPAPPPPHPLPARTPRRRARATAAAAGAAARERRDGGRPQQAVAKQAPNKGHSVLLLFGEKKHFDQTACVSVWAVAQTGRPTDGRWFGCCPTGSCLAFCLAAACRDEHGTRPQRPPRARAAAVATRRSHARGGGAAVAVAESALPARDCPDPASDADVLRPSAPVGRRSRRRLVFFRAQPGGPNNGSPWCPLCAVADGVAVRPFALWACGGAADTPWGVGVSALGRSPLCGRRAHGLPPPRRNRGGARVSGACSPSCPCAAPRPRRPNTQRAGTRGARAPPFSPPPHARPRWTPRRRA